MTDTSLAKEQGVALLQKLATDDVFRLAFEKKPAAALAAFGIPLETIVNFPAACLCVGTLADKKEFEAARKQLSNASAEARLSMVAPISSISFGEI